MVWVKHSFIAFLVCALAGAFLVTPAAANPKYAALVVHADTGDVLFSRHANKSLYPASLTKMMTLYVLFDEIEAGRLTFDSKLQISARAARQPPSKLGLKPGTTIDVRTAIKSLIVKSANDVAVVVAEGISGSESQFATRMTKKARDIGMRNTVFYNASGLPNRRQLTTARDLATLSRRLMQDFPQHFHFFSEKSFTWNGRTYRTHNSLVRTFDGATGLKTGYTHRSGYNLATSAERDGHRLIGIVLGGRTSRTRDAHMRSIMTQSYAKIKGKPSLITALHRHKPTPRLKPGSKRAPVLVASNYQAPTLGSVPALRADIEAAALSFSLEPQQDEKTQQAENDFIRSLISASVSDDLNESEHLRLISIEDPSIWGEGEGDRDLDSLEIWDVQIGAYKDKSLAQRELEAAARLCDEEELSRMVIPVTTKKGDRLYRARFVSLNENDARQTCDLLKAATRECIVVSDRSIDTP